MSETTKIDDGGPAAPYYWFYFHPDIDALTVREQSPGLSKREEYAKAAMQGLCANSELSSLQADKVAAWAVQHADALISELKKGAQG